MVEQLSNVVAVATRKGGVGKTVTTTHLARAARRRGLSVLAVDMDPQGSLTRLLAAEDVAADDVTIADVLSERAQLPLGEVVARGHWGVDLVPAGDPLDLVRSELAAATVGREMRLRQALQPVAGGYDVVLLDCPPDLSLLTVNALVAARTVLPVTLADLLSLDGLAKLLQTVQAIRASYNADLAPGPVVVSQWKAHRSERDRWEELTSSGLNVFPTPIPQRTAIKDAAEAGAGLDEWPGGYALAEIYLDLLDSVMKELNR